MRRDDVEITDRLMARDEGALRSVITEYGGLVNGMARRVISEPTLAEEVAQDTFLALWRRPGAFDPQRGSLKAFLLGVARNKAIDLVRREESLKRTRSSLANEMHVAPTATSPTAEVDERDRVKNALVTLTPLQQEAVVLAYFGGRTYREVAAELGIPAGTAKTRLRDGLHKLRELMEPDREGS